MKSVAAFASAPVTVRSPPAAPTVLSLRVTAALQPALCLQVVVLTALLGLAAPALARHAEGSDNVATLEALAADPQLVISRESLIASMTEPDARSVDPVSSPAGDASSTGIGARDTAPNRHALTGDSSGVGTKARSRPLPVETALTAASAALEDATSRNLPGSQQEPQEQQQQQQRQPEQHEAAAAREDRQELHVSKQQGGRSDAGASNGSVATATAQTAKQQPGGPHEEDEDEDENDVELRTADGDLPVRWLDCKVRSARRSSQSAKPVIFCSGVWRMHGCTLGATP